MSGDETEQRRLLCSMSLGYTAYHVWAAQARRERKYNIARLLEASSNVKRVRAERAFRALGEVGNTATNIGRALAGLEPATVATGPVTGTGTLSRELMSRAAAALAEGRDLLAEELGDLYVCGSCGELMEGDPPAVCPACGTVREGFLSFRAAEGMGILGPQSIVKKLEQTPATLRALVSGLDDELLAYPVGGRSLKELVGHLTDMDVVFRERAWLILETDNPRLPSAHPPTIARAAAYRTQPMADLLDAFQTSRQQTLGLLRGLTMAAWHRTGYHLYFGTIPLTHQGNWVVEHERRHLVEMAQIRNDLLTQRHEERPIVLPHNLVPEVLEGE
ncbi:MAG: DinB family protein [Chloroflexi bacterium OHK40]